MQEARGWTQREFAEKAHVPQSTISSLKRNNYQPTMPTLESLCGAFGMSIIEFLTDSYIPIELTTDQKELLEIYNLLDDEQKAAVRHIIKVMK